MGLGERVAAFFSSLGDLPRFLRGASSPGPIPESLEQMRVIVAHPGEYDREARLQAFDDYLGETQILEILKRGNGYNPRGDEREVVGQFASHAAVTLFCPGYFREGGFTSPVPRYHRIQQYVPILDLLERIVGAVATQEERAIYQRQRAKLNEFLAPTVRELTIAFVEAYRTAVGFAEAGQKEYPAIRSEVRQLGEHLAILTETPLSYVKDLLRFIDRKYRAAPRCAIIERPLYTLEAEALQAA